MKKRRLPLILRPVVVSFDGPAFSAMYAAEKWCQERGVSVGRLQAHAPRGLLYGDYDIQKWRNLRQHERDALHGVMTGDMRNGPVIITITRTP